MNATLLAAVKLGDQIERFGAYAGYASVIGLGVLAMLYFAQAREVKRLREWAGRAPERDAELAQRVQSDAQRRVVAQPAAAPGAQPNPQPVQPAAPQTPAAQQAEAARKAAAAAVMQKFQQPGAAQAQPPGLGPPGQLARPGSAAGPGGARAQRDRPQARPAASASPATTPPAPAPAPVVAPTAATAGAVAAARQETVAAGAVRALTNGAGVQDTHESAAARPSLPPDPPRTARAAGDARPVEEGGGPRARIGLIAGGAAAALAVVVVLAVLLTGGSDAPPADNAIGDSPPPAGSAPAAATPKVDRKATQVAVLNGTTQNGLAGSVASKIEDRGFTILSKGNNADQKVATTTSPSARAARTRRGSWRRSSTFPPGPCSRSTRTPPRPWPPRRTSS